MHRIEIIISVISQCDSQARVDRRFTNETCLQCSGIRNWYSLDGTGRESGYPGALQCSRQVQTAEFAACPARSSVPQDRTSYVKVWELRRTGKSVSRLPSLISRRRRRRRRLRRRRFSKAKSTNLTCTHSFPHPLFRVLVSRCHRMRSFFNTRGQLCLSPPPLSPCAS